jgi:hypothetical protein
MAEVPAKGLAPNASNTSSMNPKEQIIDYREVGATGLRRFSGFIYEEFLLELTGWKGCAVFKEMGDNDSVISGLLYAIDKIVRRVPWRVQPASKHPNDIEAAEFLEQCQNDMDQTWIDMMGEIMSMLQYGFSVHEIVYKRRCGDGFDPTMRSKYSDGRIGWRGVPIRSQDTIYRWQFDDHGNIQGVEQLAPPHYYHVTIPAEKMLLFRTTVHKNNPEGRSILRGAYRSWYMKKNIENIEAIGIERDLAGLPMASVPPEILSQNASADQRALLSAIKTMVTNIRRDEQEGIVFPLAYDTNGKEMYKLELLTTGGSRQFDTDKVVQRYDHRMAMSCLADFLLLGQGANAQGSWAMHSDKTKLFSQSIGAFLDIVCETFNRFAVPRLFALNDFQITDYPKIMHGDIEAVDLKELSGYIKTLTDAGMPMFPDEKLEQYLKKVANLPEAIEEEEDVDQQIEPVHREKPEKVTEIPAEPMQLPSGLDVRSDTTPVNQKPPVSVVTTNESGNTERTSQQNATFNRNQTPSQYTRDNRWFRTKP